MRRGSDRKSTRLNSSHTVIYTLSLHDALPICFGEVGASAAMCADELGLSVTAVSDVNGAIINEKGFRSEEHTSELQSHRDLHSFPTRRSSDLFWRSRSLGGYVC